MGNIIVTAASGQGSQALGATRSVNEIFYSITTLGPLATLQGHLTPHRTYQAGWLGVGFIAAAGVPSYVTHGRYLEFEAEDHIADGHVGFAFANTLWWDLSTGTEAIIQIVWV